MNSFRPEKVYNMDADRGKYFLKDVFDFFPLGALRAGEGRHKRWARRGENQGLATEFYSEKITRKRL
jgi:hypothetical protein